MSRANNRKSGMEPFGGTFLGIKTGSLIAAVIGGILRIIIKRKEGIANNATGFAVGVIISLIATDAATAFIAVKAGIESTEGLHTAIAAILALVGNDLCIAALNYLKTKGQNNATKSSRTKTD